MINMRRIVANLICLMSMLIVVFAMTGLGQAADLSKAKDVVDPIRLADPPEVSTDTKKDPSGIPAKEFKHEEKGLKIKEPPPPPKKMDPDVQKGYDDHQKKYKRK